MPAPPRDDPVTPGGGRGARGPGERMLLSADGVRISALHRPRAGQGRAAPGAPAGAPGPLALVVAHGFSGSWRRPMMARVVGRLARTAGVVAVDLRGHGASAGASTLGRDEVYDLDAAVAWARLLGYPRVATVGFSMGASVVVRHAGLVGGVDAAASVSGPAFWYYRGTPVMRRLHRAVGTRTGRALVRAGMRTRVDATPWPDPPPVPPVDAAALVPPVPFLVVHGRADRFFPAEHPDALAEAARRGARERCPGAVVDLWHEDFGHAEAAAPDDLLDRIAAWADRHAAAGGPTAGAARESVGGEGSAPRRACR